MNYYTSEYVVIPTFRKAEIVKLFNKIYSLLRINNNVRIQANYLKDKLISFLSQNIKSDFSYINYVQNNIYVIDIFIESTKLISLKFGNELMSIDFESNLIVDYAKIDNINNIKKFLEDLIKLNSKDYLYISNIKSVADNISTENMELFIDMDKYHI